MNNPATRARDLGLAFRGTPGPLNAITDVPGVLVGHTTLIRGEGALEVGRGPVRTGVTAILPRGQDDTRLAFGGAFCWNGIGEVTGLTWLEERGLVEGPILITNTHGVGVVRDVAIQWMRRRGWVFGWTTPIVGETYDGLINDIDGGHVRPEHVHAALDGARGGAVAEGCVGGGTGMMCFEYKGGIGAASRRLSQDQGGYTVGVLVQANFGRRRRLRIDGLEGAPWLVDDMPGYVSATLRPKDAPYPFLGAKDDDPAGRLGGLGRDGSIIVVVATDAPLLPHQLRRLAKRPALGIARLGGGESPGSGDIFVTFSTANPGVVEAIQDGPSQRLDVLVNGALAPLFEAAADATEEAIVNALVAATPMVGANGFRLAALPHDRVKATLSARKGPPAAGRRLGVNARIAFLRVSS
jgi:L-aminopeptidase/D-esterase-like protein